MHTEKDQELTIDFEFEQLEAALAPDFHGICACTTSCKCTSSSCVAWVS